MKLSAALAKLKNLRSQAARTEKYIEASVIRYEDDTPEYVYSTEIEKRTDLENQIMQLKTKIQLANALTTVEYGGGKVSLTGLILLNARLRTELAFWQGLLNKSVSESSALRSLYAAERTKDHLKKVYADGYDKTKIRTVIDSLESQKEQLEGILATANSTTDLIEPVAPQATEASTATADTVSEAEAPKA